MLSHLALYAAAFVGIWIGSGLTIKAVEHLSRKLKLSSFAVSFLLLGFFTSASEISVGINSVLTNNPEIYVGNLIGASLVLFVLVVPLLAIVTGKVVINKQFQGSTLFYSLIVIAAPVVLAADGRIGKIDSIICIVLYVILAVAIESKRGLLAAASQKNPISTIHMGKIALAMLGGLALVFFSSKIVVSQTLYLSETLGISSFLLSLLLISIGTNVPELSFVFRSLFSKSNQVAFGDYVGSAAFNTFLIGILTLYYGQTVQLTNSYLVSLSFLVVSLVVFYIYARTKGSLSRLEGFCLLVFYLLFLGTEILIHS